jgi:hypothetical protein
MYALKPAGLETYTVQIKAPLRQLESSNKTMYFNVAAENKLM